MPKVPKELAAVLPFEEIQSYFSKEVTREELHKADLAAIIQKCPSDVFSLAINCCIRAKQIYRPDLDTTPLIPQIESRNPAVVNTLSSLLKQVAIDDIYCCRCTVDGQLVATLLIAQVWPRDLYVGMVMFADPSQPIPVYQRKSVLQKFRGLGLLSNFLERVDLCAVARGCQNITLIANETSQMMLFAKYGFAVDSHLSAQTQLAQGIAIPMHKSIV